MLLIDLTILSFGCALEGGDDKTEDDHKVMTSIYSCCSRVPGITQ